MARQLRFGVVILGVVAGIFTLLDLASGRAEPPGKKYAFLVGVNQYDKRGFPDLAYAERDVIELEKVLRAGGYEVILLTGSADKADQRATKANIDRQFQDLLKRVTKKDLVMLAFAGHGQQVEVDQKTQPFFCPRDAVQNDAASLVAINKIMADLDQKGGGQNLVLIDACRNDPTPGRGTRGIDGNEAETLKAGMAVLFSCSRGQRAFETKKAGGGHGVFFHYVLEGLRGGAARDGGDVTWDRLVTYVTENVDAHLDDLLPKEERGDVTQTPHKVENIIGKAPVLLSKKDIGETVLESPKTLKLDLGRVDLELVLLNAKGNAVFQMGAPDGEKEALDSEKPQHKVTLTKPFYLGKFHVTRGQFAVFVKATNYKTEAETGNGAYGHNDKGEYVKSKDFSWKKTGFAQTDEHPVVNVSWNDAKHFCDWLVEDTGVQRQLKAKVGQRKMTIRLPSEAEWEYACRAGTTTPFHFGTALNGKQANCNGNYPYGTEEKGPYLKGTSKVGQYQKNNFGLYDMHGNAWQWCEDYYGPYEAQDQRDPLRTVKHSKGSRVLRGGSWYYRAVGCRAAYRYSNAPDDRYSSSGFRACVRLD